VVSYKYTGCPSGAATPGKQWAFYFTDILRSGASDALDEVDGKMDYEKYPQSRINAHSNLRGAEWELEKEIERLKQFLDRMK